MRRYLLFAATTLSLAASAQTQSELYYMDERGRDALLKPRVGVGAGVFTFFGDVNDNNYAHVFTSSLGYEFVASRNISRYFNLDLKAFVGNISVNERTNERNLNFRSQLFVGGVGVSYNFNHLYKKPGIIQPYVGLGFSYINFNSKTDLQDANGNTYHYWPDGSIHDAARTVENYNTSPVINRDYKYETDLRDMNNDGLGDYDEFTFAFPVSIGVDFRLSRRLSAKLGTTFYPTFSDLIDDVSDAGKGVRQGNSAPDMFLFSSLSVSYSLGMNKPEVKSSKEDFFGDVDFYATEIGDTDQDGVNDFDDRCAGTPSGAKVNEFGCPLDDDTDVIENYRDDQAATPAESIVDLRGVSMNDSTIEARYKPEAGLKRSYIPILYPSGILEKASEPKMTLGDSLKLIETMALIMESGKNPTPVDATLKEFAAEVKKVVGKNSNDPEAVYEAIEAVNARLTQAANDPKKKKGAAPANAPLAGVNLENSINTSIPDQFRPADYDNNGIITSEEMQRVIEEALEGTGPFRLEQMYQLIDFYQDEMADVRVVDFGGTLGVYIEGELNILKNYKAEDKRTDAQRFLVNKFKEVDFNGDGILEPNEVQRMIDLFQEGKSTYTSDMINELIDLFFEQ